MLGNLKITDTDALILIDVQNDFLPGGALAVPRGDEILPVIHSVSQEFSNIVITQDWHPAGHSSFASSHEGKKPFDAIQMDYGTQILWPDHCVQGSHGAELRLDAEILNRSQLVIRKGFRPSVDSYSAFVENDMVTKTGLSGYLRSREITRVFLAGLATDFCVGFSAISAMKSGFETCVLTEACRGITPEGVDSSYGQMREFGVSLI